MLLLLLLLSQLLFLLVLLLLLLEDGGKGCAVVVKLRVQVVHEGNLGQTAPTLIYAEVEAVARLSRASSV